MSKIFARDPAARLDSRFSNPKSKKNRRRGRNGHPGLFQLFMEQFRTNPSGRRKKLTLGRVKNAARRTLGLNKKPRIGELIAWRLAKEIALPTAGIVLWLVYKIQSGSAISDLSTTALFAFGYLWYLQGQFIRIDRSVRDRERDKRGQREIHAIRDELAAVHALLYAFHSKESRSSQSILKDVPDSPHMTTLQTPPTRAVQPPLPKF
jgi:hypothetical protein